VIATAGDIACLRSTASSTTCHQGTTAGLIRQLAPSAVLALGDEQYETGTLDAFTGSYDPAWGQFKDITKPVPGNHEYQTAGASGYYSYFGAAAGDPTKGYYSYDIASWHMIALNGNCSAVGGCGPGSPQERWLAADLASKPRTCTLAYWHQPRFSSGEHGDEAPYDAFWKDLYAAGADVVLNGHDHDYERFAPQNPAAQPDPSRGIREFVVGTGGKSHYNFPRISANSEVRNGDTFGILKMTLHPKSYDWQFLPEPGATFTDSGTGGCH
jgi:acid phosphatase type 7